MTKKDYIIVAQAIEHEVYGWKQSKSQVANPLQVISAIITELSDRFIEDNPRFDKKRFIEACGFMKV
jgi:hypothetical protein